MKCGREGKKMSKKLPRQCVHGMALGDIIKHMGWKLSSFTLYSQGCCWLFFFFLVLLQSEIYSWTQTGGHPADVCFQTRQTWLWRRPQTDPELQPRPGSPSLPSPATCCPPCVFNSAQSPEKTPQLHKWLIYSSFKKKKKDKECCCTREHLTLAEKKYSAVTVWWQARFHCLKSPLRFSLSLMETLLFLILYTNQRKSRVSMW